jgi:hypothetical protein
MVDLIFMQMTTIVYIIMIFDAKFSEIILQSKEVEEKNAKEKSARNQKAIIIYAEIIAFIVIDLIYILEYFAGYHDVSIDFSSKVAVAIFTLAQFIRLVIENYLIVILALLLEFFVERFSEKKKSAN